MAERVEAIKEKNEEINRKIRDIVNLIKEQGLTAFSEEDEGKKNLHPFVRKILEMEMRKCAEIYKAEFPEFECKSIEELEVFEKQKNEFNCLGGSNGITVYTGIQSFIDEKLKDEKWIEEYEEKEGIIYATRFKEQDIPPNYQKGNKLVDSTRDQADYFAELVARDKIDLDVMLDVLPHEAMHIFIHGGGKFFIEGVTERLTREVSDKYGLRLSPTSHQRETEILERIEKIVGRDGIASINIDNDKKYKILEEKVDKKMGEGTFKRLKTSFDEQYEKFEKEDRVKFNAKDYRSKNYYKGALEELDKWIQEHPDRLAEEDNEQEIDEEIYISITAHQKEEIKQLDSILEKMKTKERFTAERGDKTQELEEKKMNRFKPLEDFGDELEEVSKQDKVNFEIQIEDEIKPFIDSQIERYKEVSLSTEKRKPLQINQETGEVIFEEGTLIHCANSCGYSKLTSISEKGIISGEFLGIPEDGESYYCADFYRADKKINSSELFERIYKSDEMFCRGPFGDQPKYRSKLAFIIEPRSDLKNLLDTDMFRPENSDHIMQSVLNLIEEYKNEKNGQIASIPYGLPSNAISGIIVGDYLLQNDEYMNLINELFPNSYVLTREGKVFSDPILSKEENETRKKEYLQSIKSYEQWETEFAKDKVNSLLEDTSKKEITKQQIEKLAREEQVVDENEVAQEILDKLERDKQIEKEKSQSIG